MPKVPSSTTGTATAGIRVTRQSCRNRNITATTRTIASIRVTTTCSIESLMKVVESTGKLSFRPGGKLAASCVPFCLTRSAVVSALAPGESWIATPPAGSPFRRVVDE